jgi:hypothetical protein
MRLSVLALLLTAAACSSTPPAANPKQANDPPCPTDVATLIGHACATEGRSCGGASGTGFSNIARCEGGTWQQIEVPPPPPPPPIP